ncbi:phosphotransferase family protein [Blastococcus mobilis]|uniref:Predicted kinase, aminoglycoside phosphotransferase (APT) family n=1 Tax=Blastococcus mobilis TaxID=1938746 RepID=A0A238ZE01_9ACTN|nr:phosphotransferase family protein [Blastococcus mobilis]SNR80914.1 Predicted kinase, aminoglycoside phosphotransferase (APT) family [Blastococcus mobilis]
MAGGTPPRRRTAEVRSPDSGVEDLVDVAALQDWMQSQGVTDGPVRLGETLGGGTQNVLIKVRTGDRDMVLRRGPRHLRPRTNDMLRREMRVLEALSGTEVPHARLIAACPDEEVLGGAVFYLMEEVDGFNPAVGLSGAASRSLDVRRHLCLSTAAAAATLAAVDHEAVGLGDMGNPTGFLERQVGRWRSELVSYSSFAGYDGPDLPGVEALGDWLDDNRPAQWRPGILHGDYHLANVLCDHRTGSVAAVVDWEMTTIGDPLLDLGWLLATWPRGDGPEILSDGVRALAGVVDRDDLVREYAERSTRDLSSVDWYVVLACYKLAIVQEGTYARACAGLAPREVGDRLHAGSLVLLARAREITGT